MSDYHFTSDWFGERKRMIWDRLIPDMKPRRVLEIGSFEGASATYLIEACKSWRELELHCVDTWSGGVEHQGLEMDQVEQRFRSNIDSAKSKVDYLPEVCIHEGRSDCCLPKIMTEIGSNFFDLVYIDGSHQAPDVLFDAVVGFKLLRIGGLMIFDDYLWGEKLSTGYDPLRSPKVAIDAFINTNIRKLDMLPTPQVQIYLKKRAD